jgi:hypothetical protein
MECAPASDVDSRHRFESHLWGGTAGVSAVYSGVKCTAIDVREKDDVISAFFGGCAAGATLAFKCELIRPPHAARRHLHLVHRRVGEPMCGEWGEVWECVQDMLAPLLDPNVVSPPLSQHRVCRLQWAGP